LYFKRKFRAAVIDENQIRETSSRFEVGLRIQSLIPTGYAGSRFFGASVRQRPLAVPIPKHFRNSPIPSRPNRFTPFFSCPEEKGLVFIEAGQLGPAIAHLRDYRGAGDGSDHACAGLGKQGHRVAAIG